MNSEFPAADEAMEGYFVLTLHEKSPFSFYALHCRLHFQAPCTTAI